MKIIMFILSLAICVSCGAKNEAPIFYYEETKFQVSKISEVENFVKSVSKNWGFKVFEKDRKAMSALTKGEEAFFIGLYKDNQHILTITNVGVGSTLRMSIYGDNDLEKGELQKLGDEIAQGLMRSDIKLSKQ